jgi:molybdopterin-guanine dinucleotide biosynthesis adapter protein
MKPYVIGFYGKSNTGKTTLISDLIKKLTNAKYKVATIKCSDKKISFDKEEKDTYKHSQAGANPVVLSSVLETDFIIKKKLSIKDILSYLTAFEKIDVIFIESVNEPDIPKVRIGDIQKRENTILDYKGDFEKLYKFIEGKIRNDEYE